MHAHTYKPTQTFTNTNSFWAHTPQPSALGLDPVRTIVELLPLLLLDGNCLWVLYHSLSCVCAPVRVRREFACLFAGVCICQPACTCNPALHPITLHSRSILLHPATNMYVTSPSILSPLRCSVTTAPASASDCLWWLTVTQPPFLLVCPSRYKSLMILCGFFFVFAGVCVCFVCLCTGWFLLST